jgi:DNA-directed RNA polymerase subunit RPC12/RpoP
MEKLTNVDVANNVKNKKNLRKVRTVMLTLGIIAELIEDGLIAVGAIYNWWWMIAVGAVFALATAVWISTYYFKSVNYKCPECGTVFKPKFWSAFFAPHTPRTRTLTCPNCSKRSRCLEVYDDKTIKE